jgi:CO/xanthine dehydrogenase FAD-binding subunit
MLFFLDQWSNSTQYPVTLPIKIFFITVKKKWQTANFAVMSAHIKKIANTPVRSVGSWAGNVMLAHNHTWFPSDMYLVLLGAVRSVSEASNDRAPH